MSNFKRITLARMWSKSPKSSGTWFLVNEHTTNRNILGTSRTHQDLTMFRSILREVHLEPPINLLLTSSILLFVNSSYSTDTYLWPLGLVCNTGYIPYDPYTVAVTTYESLTVVGPSGFNTVPVP